MDRLERDGEILSGVGLGRLGDEAFVLVARLVCAIPLSALTLGQVVKIQVMPEFVDQRVFLELRIVLAEQNALAVLPVNRIRLGWTRVSRGNDHGRRKIAQQQKGYHG